MTFLQWCLSPYCQIIALQQESLSDIHPWRSHSRSHLGNNVITSILDTMMLLLVLDFEVVLAFVLAVKLHQHLSFQCSHLKSFCNVATLRVFTIKPCQHLSLYWSHANIHLCHEAIFPLASTICHTIICTEAVPTFIFVTKPCQHSTLALALALKLHQYLHWSRANIHLCHEAMSTLHFRRSQANVHLYYETMTTLHLSISINFQR